MGGSFNDPLRLAARLALVRSLAPCGEAAGRVVAGAGEVLRIRAAIAQLSERQREVFLAVRLHDRPLRQVADALDLPLTVAEREFAAALLAIMRALECD